MAKVEAVLKAYAEAEVPVSVIGTTQKANHVTIRVNGAVVLDEDMAQDIVNAGRASMGQELNQMDLVSVNLFADKWV